MAIRLLRVDIDTMGLDRHKERQIGGQSIILKSPAPPVRSGFQFDQESLDRLVRQCLRLFWALTLGQFKGGQSSPTYRLAVGSM